MNATKKELLNDMKDMKDFLDRYPGWNGMATDARTKAAVAGLVLLGIARENKYNQLKKI